MSKLSNKELADVFYYCATLSRLVSPRDAAKYFGFTFDGAVTDTLRGLAIMYDSDGDINKFKADELYGPVFKQMITDVNAL